VVDGLAAAQRAQFPFQGTHLIILDGNRAKLM